MYFFKLILAYVIPFEKKNQFARFAFYSTFPLRGRRKKKGETHFPFLKPTLTRRIGRFYPTEREEDLYFSKKKNRFLFITTIKPISLFPSLLQNELVKKRERFNAARRIGWNRSRSKHVEHASTMGINQRGSRWVERE